MQTNTRPVRKVLLQMDKMEERINSLKTTEECEIFSRNAVERGYPGLATKAQRRAVDLQTAAHETDGLLEKDTVAAVYAYQFLLSERKGKKTRATALWQSIKRWGMIEAVRRMVCSPESAANYAAMHDAGMQDLTFESVVVKHAADFTSEVVTRCMDRVSSLAPQVS